MYRSIFIEFRLNIQMEKYKWNFRNSIQKWMEQINAKQKNDERWNDNNKQKVEQWKLDFISYRYWCIRFWKYVEHLNSLKNSFRLKGKSGFGYYWFGVYFCFDLIGISIFLRFKHAFQWSLTIFWAQITFYRFKHGGHIKFNQNKQCQLNGFCDNEKIFMAAGLLSVGNRLRERKWNWY